MISQQDIFERSSIERASRSCDAYTMKHFHTIAAVLLLALFAQPLVVQAGTLGGISGVVTDAKTGAPVAGAHLTITSGSQQATATTDARALPALKRD